MTSTEQQLQELEKKISVMENRHKAAIAKKKATMRKVRTHFLCQIGGTALSILGDDFDMDIFSDLLKKNKHLFTSKNQKEE